MSALAPGTVVGGYRVTGLLGQGGMGAVYKGESADGRVVAIKVLLGGAPGNGEADFVARFQREARNAARVSHRNVARVHSAGEHDGRPYLVFELVPGGSLADRVRESGPLPWREAASLGAQVARGLEAIHAAGLVHRDLKPANVLLDEEGRAKVADFGLARTVGRGSIALTKTGQMVGTLEYMAPEQSEGGTAVDGRADLYALGGTIFTLLTGRPPFEGSGFPLLVQHLQQAPRSPRTLVPDIPRRLERLVLQLLAKRPQERGTIAEIATELESIAASPAGSKSRRKLVVGVALAVVAGGGAAPLLARRMSGSVPVQPDGGSTPRRSKALSGEVSFLPSDAMRAPFEDGDDESHRSVRGLRFSRRAKWTDQLYGPGSVGHRGPSTAAAFLSATRALSGGEDGRLIVWDLETRTGSAVLSRGRNVHEGAITAIAVSETGDRALTADDAGRLVLWSVKEGQRLALERELLAPGRNGPLRAAIFNGVAGIAAIAGGEGGIFRFDLAAEKPASQLSKDRTTALVAGFGESFFSGHPDGRVESWDSSGPSGRIVKGEAPVSSLDFYRDADLFSRLLVADAATPDHPGSIHAHGLGPNLGVPEGVVRLDKESRACVFGDDRSHPYAVDTDGAIICVDLGTGKSWAPDPGTSEKHRGPASSIARSPDSKRLISTGADHSVRLWNGERPPRQLASLGDMSRVRGLASALVGKDELLAVAWEGPDPERTIARVTLRGTRKLEPASMNRMPTCVDVSGRNGRVLAGFNDGRVRLYDFKEGSGDSKGFRCSTVPTSVAWLEDGVHFVAGESGGVLSLFDVDAARDEPLARVPLPSGVLGIAAGTGDELVCFGAGFVAWVACRREDHRLELVRTTARSARAVAIDSDSRATDEVILGLEDGLGAEQRDDARQQLSRIVWENARVTAVARRKTLVLSAGLDGTVRIFDLDASREIARIDFTPLDDVPTAVAFQPDDATSTQTVFFVGTERGAVHRFQVEP
jgi:serine/threonine protein kinase/WD40 repeat protein